LAIKERSWTQLKEKEHSGNLKGVEHSEKLEESFKSYSSSTSAIPLKLKRASALTVELYFRVFLDY